MIKLKFPYKLLKRDCHPMLEGIKLEGKPQIELSIKGRGFRYSFPNKFFAKPEKIIQVEQYFKDQKC